MDEKTDEEAKEFNMEDCAPTEEGRPAEPSENVPEQAPCQFFLLGRCRFGDRCRNTHSGLSEITQSHPSTTHTSEKGKDASESKTKKKPSMKTATDVISRIQWDTILPKEHFSIGYLDRFLGVIEKPFSEFSWEDFASVGYDVLAIPKHRIQYFKYQSTVVWDKTTRVDNVFGSTGSGLTILDVIDQYETLSKEENNIAHTEDNTPEDTDYLVRDDEYVDKECDYHPDDQYKAKKLKPTHFVAVRIIDDDVKSSVKEVQGALLKWNPDIVDYCTPLPALHLTLCLLRLETPEEIQKAFTVLQEWRCEIQRILPPSLILRFQGLKDFNARVLYLAPSALPELSNFSHTLNERFCKEGLTVVDPPGNNLHVTIAKIPTSTIRKNPRLLLLSNVYGHIPITHFGAQHVDSLFFCHTGSSRRTDGFYTTLLELPLY
ncbi:leukocyte receptor cluster member 9 [Pelodytes ibericus]